MSLITRQWGCTGLTIWSTKKKQIVLWYMPPWTTIPWHRHPGVNTRIFTWFGEAYLYKQRDAQPPLAKHWSRSSSRPAWHNISDQTYHAAQTELRSFTFLVVAQHADPKWIMDKDDAPACNFLLPVHLPRLDYIAIRSLTRTTKFPPVDGGSGRGTTSNPSSGSQRDPADLIE